jgi:catechol 2,3-dioxygenase-like lactoylglutathione lyase family enzyme
VRIRLDHVVIHVSDWERSNAFYRDVLGAELIEKGDGSPSRHYRLGDQQLNVHGPGMDPSPVAAKPVMPTSVYFRDPDGSLLELISYER